MRMATGLVVLTLSSPAATAQQQAAAPPTLVLRGVVTTANDVPLPRVRVTLAAAIPPELARSDAVPELQRGVLTDERGQFTIAVPAAGPVRLTFSKARYVTRTAEVPSRGPIAQGRDVRVRMSLASAISGQVFDQTGDPVMLAIVTLQRVGVATTLSTTTNDLGEFRFGGLAEGSYAITARPPVLAPGTEPAHRDAANAAAVKGRTVTVSFGAETANINLAIDVPTELKQDAAKRTDSDPEATASLSGRIVRVDGTPIARAVVHAHLANADGRRAETDERGRYRIEGLGSGEYTVEAWKYGFWNGQYGQNRAVSLFAGRPVPVRKGQAVDSIDVVLGRGGAIAGTIIDEFGEPAQDVAITAHFLLVVADRARWIRASVPGNPRTDDRGQYRLFGLQPGTYVVQATVGDTLSAARGYSPQFYPGSSSLNHATPLTVRADAATTGIDLALIPTAAHRVTGIVLDSSGKPAPATLTLGLSERSGAVPTAQARAWAGADGRFEFVNVGAGDYVVHATRFVAGTASDGRVTTDEQFAVSFVTVIGNDPPAAQLTLAAGARVRGRVRYEGARSGPSAFLLAALPTERDLAPPLGDGWNSAALEPDDVVFEFTRLFGPTLLSALTQDTPWYLKSVVFNGQELVDSPFDFGTIGTFNDIEVVLSALGATVSGRVTDDRAAPVSEYAVLLFSPERDRWFVGSRWVRTAGSSRDGTFRVTGLPPGDYWVAAIDTADRPAGDRAPAPDPTLLESLSSRAVHLRLGEGQSQDLTLRLLRR